MKKAIFLIVFALFLSAGTALAAQVNVNTASQAELVALPDIGEVKAEAIIEYRKAHGEFDNLAGLTKVDGIGDATVEGLQDKATTSSSE